MNAHSRTVSLHHIALGARSVQRVASFYREVFGLKELARHRYADGQIRSIWLDLNGAILMIEKTDRTREIVQGIDAGAFLMAFGIEASKRVEVEGLLESSGHPIESRTDDTSYFRDPEGNRIAVSSYKLPRPSAPSDSEIR